MTRKYLSRTIHFQENIKPKEETTLFNIEGTGSFQKLEITAKGSEYSSITLLIDDEVCLQETFDSLNKKASRYITRYSRPSGEPIGKFAVEIDLQKNFFKSLKFSATNKHASLGMQIKGTVHYNSAR